jgi:hypothetical protein
MSVTEDLCFVQPRDATPHTAAGRPAAGITHATARHMMLRGLVERGHGATSYRLRLICGSILRLMSAGMRATPAPRTRRAGRTAPQTRSTTSRSARL